MGKLAMYGGTPIFRVEDLPKELEQCIAQHPDLAQKPCIMVVQTTFNQEVWKKCEKNEKNSK